MTEGALFVPLNIGTAFQTDMGPQEANCPKAISMRKSGSPARININTYGIRNVAETGRIQIASGNANTCHFVFGIWVSLNVFTELVEFSD